MKKLLLWGVLIFIVWKLYQKHLATTSATTIAAGASNANTPAATSSSSSPSTVAKPATPVPVISDAVAAQDPLQAAITMATNINDQSDI